MNECSKEADGQCTLHAGNLRQWPDTTHYRKGKHAESSGRLISVSYHNSETDHVCTITLLFLCHLSPFDQLKFFMCKKDLTFSCTTCEVQYIYH